MKIESKTLCRVRIEGTLREMLDLFIWMQENKLYCFFLIYSSDQYYDALFDPATAQVIMDHILKDKES